MANMSRLNSGSYDGASLGDAATNIASMFKPTSVQDIYLGQQVQQAKANALARQQGLAALAAGGRQDLVDAINAGVTPDVAKASGMLKLQGLANQGVLDRNTVDQMGVASGLFSPTNSYGMETDRENTKLAQTGMQERGNIARANIEQAGLDRRLSTDQQMARALGTLSPDEQANIARIKTTGIENVVGPDGKPVNMTGVGALGQRPVLKADKQTEISQLIAERDALPVNDPNRAAYDSRIAALGRGQQQGAYDRSNDEGLAKLNEEIFKGGSGAVGDRNMLTLLKNAINDPNTPQGSLADTKLALAKLGNTFGLSMGDTSPAEIVNAVGNQLALRLRDPENGGGMPGSLSDSDREFLRSMSISLGNSAPANLKLLKYYMAIQQKNIDLENMRRQYIMQHGRLDEGFRSGVSDYLQQNNPYATEASGPQPGQGGLLQPVFKVLGVR